MSEELANNVTQEVTLDVLLRESLRRAIHASPMKRESICKELTKFLRRKISLTMLDAWTAESKGAWHLPADVVPPLCTILEDDSIQRHLLSPKLREALELGESAARVQLLLQKSLSEAKELDLRRRKARCS